LTVAGLPGKKCLRIAMGLCVQVFNGIGYGTPWNGEYKGQKLPAGAYYYIVTAKNNTQKFSGSLTIVY